MDLQFCASLAYAAIFLALLSCTASAQDIIGASASVLTWKQDINVLDECSGCSYRTGENLAEATITYSSIKTDSFGQLCASAVLDGQVYAQPLVVAGKVSDVQ
jgi:hypothetical protein